MYIMTKHHSRRRRGHGKTRTRRHQRGGELAGNPPSSWGWGMGTLGNGWTQFMNSLSVQPGQNLASGQSNNIVPVGNSNAQTSQGGNIPKGGARRRRRGRSCKRGGNVAAILSQAVVPGTLLLLNQTARRRHRKR
jgi:hypothetical protein